jgi:hypothetical protein
MEDGVIRGECEEEIDPAFLYKELMTNGHGYTIEDYGEIIEGTKGTIFSIRTMHKGTRGDEPGLADAFANALVDIKVCEMTQCSEPEVGGESPHYNLEELHVLLSRVLYVVVSSHIFAPPPHQNTMSATHSVISSWPWIPLGMVALDWMSIFVPRLFVTGPTFKRLPFALAMTSWKWKVVPR